MHLQKVSTPFSISVFLLSPPEQLLLFSFVSFLNPLVVVYVPSYDPLPEDKILGWSKLKQIADDILKCIQNRK